MSNSNKIEDALSALIKEPTARTSDESHARTETTWSLDLPKTRIHTLEQLIKKFEIDLTTWEVERFVANKWEVGAKNAEGKIEIEPLYQVKAFLRIRKHVSDARKEIAALVQEAKRLVTVKHRPAPKASKSGVMVELSVPDLHLGKLAWGKETGHENYDSAEAVRLFGDANAQLLARTEHYKPSRILMVVGNDMLHIDNLESLTTAGTRMDSDSRYFKLFTTARVMVAEAIQAARHIAPVEVVMVPGNHDRHSVWHLGHSLECLFNGDKRVRIVNEPSPRQYLQHGVVMLGLTHGNKVKHEQLPLLMATERPEMHGATRFREMHTGHFHRKSMIEINGIRVRVLPSLCAADAWHAENGFVGNLRQALAIVWHEQEGEIATATWSPQK